MMKRNITAFLLSASVCLILGCHRYVEVPVDEKVLLVTKGDKVLRSLVEPKEIEVPWNGVVLSEGEHQRLMEIENEWAINRKPLGKMKLR